MELSCIGTKKESASRQIPLKNMSELTYSSSAIACAAANGH